MWWLSYANEQGFRGVVIVEADDFITACAKVGLSGLSPGGQVLGEPVHGIPPLLLNRLLTESELRSEGLL